MTDFIVWYLLITLAGWIAFPLAFRLLPMLPDRGFTLARPLSLLLWGFGFWLLTSLGLLQNDSGGTLLGLALLAGLSIWSLRGGGTAELLAWVRAKKGLVITAEVLFLVAFAFWAFIRAGDPNILGTEKPMEMAFINAILRSPAFPPNDPWLSGYSISYYYFGYVMVAMLIRLAGVEPGVGFNLAITSWFGLTALASYGVVYSLLSAYGARAAAAGRRIGAQSWALLAPFFLLIVSNVEGFLEVLHSRGIFWRQAADGTWQSGFWRWLNMPEICAPPSPPLSWVPERAAGIWWWRASRVVQDFDMSHVARMASGEQCMVGREVIDEFPFFSYYLADLHPHVLAMPFALLAVGLALHLYLKLRRSPIDGIGLLAGMQGWIASTPVDWRQLALLQWVRRADFWLAAITAGGLAFLNTWDFPIYVALFAGAYSLAHFGCYGWNIRRITEFVENGAALGAAGILLYLPFYFGFSSQAGGVLPSLGFFTRGINFWIMFAPLLVPIILWLVWYWVRRGNRSALRTGLIFSAALIFGLWIISYLFGGLVLSLGGIGNSLTQAGSGIGATLRNLGGLFMSLQYGELASVYADHPTAVIWNSIGRRLASPGTWMTLYAIIAGAWALLAARQKGAGKDRARMVENEGILPSIHPFVLLLVLVGAGLALVPEFLYLRDQFATRMNTIFKFYFQVWILWSLVAAFATAILWQAVSLRWAIIGRGLIGLVIIMGLAYPFFALSMRIESMAPVETAEDGRTRRNFSGIFERITLDGTAHIDRFNPDEMAAIRYLRNAPLGIVAEAVGGQYSGFARIATNTGLPNVLGWPGHQSQWRGGGAEMGSRQPDIQTLYESPRWSDTLAIIQRYEIRYIYIGGLERSSYRINEGKFMNYLTPVFQQGSVVIYKVPDTLFTVVRLQH
jgi:YYY domain-containing protein